MNISTIFLATFDANQKSSCTSQKCGRINHTSGFSSPTSYCRQNQPEIQIFETITLLLPPIVSIIRRIIFAHPSLHDFNSDLFVLFCFCFFRFLIYFEHIILSINTVYLMFTMWTNLTRISPNVYQLAKFTLTFYCHHRKLEGKSYQSFPHFFTNL